MTGAASHDHPGAPGRGAPGRGEPGPQAAAPSGLPAGLRWQIACYPRAWRQRYGPEFAELLLAERAERGPSGRRDANVALSGLRARLAGAGLARHPLDGAAAARAGLATIAVSLSAAGVAGVAVWARLAIGLQWTAPSSPGLVRVMDLLSAALALVLGAGLLAAAPVVWTGVLAVAQRRARPLRLPAALIAAGAAVLTVGSRHFQNHWPGTGGHLLTHQGLIPAGLAAFGWAATMWVTAYWAHPGALAAFPAGQLAWMAVSPAATGCLIAGAVQLVRRLPLSARTQRYQARVAVAGGAGAVLLAAGTTGWLATAGAVRESLFRSGLTGQASLGVLALAAIAGVTAARQLRLSARVAATPAAATRLQS